MSEETKPKKKFFKKKFKPRRKKKVEDEPNESLETESVLQEQAESSHEENLREEPSPQEVAPENSEQNIEVEQIPADEEAPEQNERNRLPDLSYEVPPFSARFMIGINGIELTNETRKLFEKYPVAGFIIFARNYSTPAQLAEMINEIQEISEQHPWRRPMLIAVDHEGTKVTRFKDPFTIFPDAEAFGKHNSRSLMFECSQIVARELKSIGVNYNFFPVADLNTNKKNPVIGKRSFNSEIDVVNKMVSTVIKAYNKNGVLSCLKHFPGHGDTAEDSHDKLPTLPYTLEELQKRELIPFAKGIEAGVPTIMLAHLLFPKIDDQIVSLSSFWVKYLREKMNFSGLIVTDDMEMGALTQGYTPWEACLKALEANVDLVLINNEKTALELIPKAFAYKDFNKENHLLTMKRLEWVNQRYLKPYRPVYIPDVTKIFHRNHSIIMKAVQDHSGKTLLEWKKLRDLPPSRRPNQFKDSYGAYLYEEYKDTSVALTAPGGRLPEEALAQNSNVKKPHKEALTVTKEQFIRQNSDRANNNNNNSRKNFRNQNGKRFDRHKHRGKNQPN